MLPCNSVHQSNEVSLFTLNNVYIKLKGFRQIDDSIQLIPFYNCRSNFK